MLPLVGHGRLCKQTKQVKTWSRHLLRKAMKLDDLRSKNPTRDRATRSPPSHPRRRSLGSKSRVWNCHTTDLRLKRSALPMGSQIEKRMRLPHQPRPLSERDSGQQDWALAPRLSPPPWTALIMTGREGNRMWRTNRTNCTWPNSRLPAISFSSARGPEASQSFPSLKTPCVVPLSIHNPF
ncbi:hypothetical protein TIFTF001_030716 [Ficus carica]|uniref:Uncharacterized protein n=1 Tax=Ficus carica TaxID=3494 RepID=A0AA88DUS1_FICCA|nr:hypothetical protein TIFTF001_030716 [Ficus carica]